MQKSKRHLWSVTILLLFSLVITLVSVFIVQCLLQLRTEIGEHTERYVSDVTIQIAQDIDNRISKVVTDLVSVSESLSMLDSDIHKNIGGYLEQKVKTLGFTSLLITDQTQVIYQTCSQQEDFFSNAAVQQALQGENGIDFLQDGSMIYTAPIYENDSKEIIGVLGGIRDIKNMQNLIQLDSFSGRGLTCIVDNEGNVIVAPTDSAPFLQLDSIFQEEDSDSDVSQSIRQMEKDLVENRPGIFRFKAKDDSDLILSYDPLPSSGWILLTLVPSDIISKTVNLYMSRVLGISLLTVCLLISIPFILFFIQRNHYRQIRQSAFVDRLTGKMNNSAFQMECEKILPFSAPETYSIVFFDIKNFKLINNLFGIGQGDMILRYVMDVLNTKVQGYGFAARAASDNFYLCLHLGNQEEILTFINDVLQSVNVVMEKYFQSLDTSYYFVLQSGVYIIEDPMLDITIMQDRAKAACQNRSDTEDGVVKFYNVDILDRMKKEQELNAMFSHSLENRDFQLYLQPKIWVQKGTVGGAEALVRWIHPQKGMIFPSDFIPMFEANGNICKLDFYIFEEVCRTLSRWLADGRTVFPVSVNLSRQHFKHPDFLSRLADLARRYRVPTNLLQLELTESIFFNESEVETVKNFIGQMHQLGFQCSLDDFGSGFSTLGLLMEFDVDDIKLDRSFFKDIHNPKTGDIVSSVIDLSRKIGAMSVAEGVETTEQLELLKKMRCDLVQGYIFSKPLPVVEFETWVQRHQAKFGL